MIRIVHRLRLVKGTNAKLKVLQQERENTIWLNILKAMYDTSKNYYVTAPNDHTFIAADDLDYARMFMELRLLETGNYRGHAGKQIALECSKEFGEIFRLILKGSLKAGVSITTINKAYPGLIPTFPLMLAENSDIPVFPVLASTKFDGVRLIVKIKMGQVTPKTRSGKILDLHSLTDAMKSFPDGVYDGELVHGSGRQVSRTKITGLVNRILNGSKTDMQGYTYHIFDMLTLDEWYSHTCIRPYQERLSTLHNSHTVNDYTRLVQQVTLTGPDEVDVMFKSHIARGFEGLILRYSDDMYEWKRTKTLIKKKAVIECVLTCYAIAEGQGKYENMIGSLECRGTVDEKEIRVSIGTGLSDYDREQDVSYFLNKQIEVVYNDIVKSDSNTVYSLFLPVFKRVVNNL